MEDSEPSSSSLPKNEGKHLEIPNFDHNVFEDSKNDNKTRDSLKHRQKSVTRIFSLEDSISKGAEELGRICQELRMVNEDLSHVVDAKQQLLTQWSSEDSQGSSRRTSNMSSSFNSNSSEDDSVCDLTYSKDIFDLCRSAEADLKMAHVAHREFQTILTDLECVWNFEEKDLTSRAGMLKRQGKDNFVKMSPQALAKLKASQQGEEKQELIQLNDLSSLSLSN